MPSSTYLSYGLLKALLEFLIYLEINYIIFPSHALTDCITISTGELRVRQSQLLHFLFLVLTQLIIAKTKWNGSRTIKESNLLLIYKKINIFKESECHKVQLQRVRRQEKKSVHGGEKMSDLAELWVLLSPRQTLKTGFLQITLPVPMVPIYFVIRAKKSPTHVTCLKYNGYECEMSGGVNCIVKEKLTMNSLCAYTVVVSKRFAISFDANSSSIQIHYVITYTHMGQSRTNGG